MTAHRAGAAWVAPTLRLLPWRVLGLPVGAAALVGLLVRTRDTGVPDEVGLAAVAATAAAVPQILADPAHRLLSAVPRNPRRRVGDRLLLFVPAVIGAWVVVAPLVVDRPDAAALSIGPLVALAGIGLAAGCLAARIEPDLGAPTGTVVSMGVVAAGIVLDGLTTRRDVLGVWIDRPWPTAAVAGLACLLSLRDAGPTRRWRPAPRPPDGG